MRSATATLTVLLLFGVLRGEAELRAEDSSAGLVPSLIGEKLRFGIEWNPPWYLFFLPSMDAGEVELSLGQTMVGDARKVLQITFKARSSGTLARLAGLQVDDHFEFLSDPDSLCTLSARKQVREGKRKRNIDVTYDPDNRRLHFREMDMAVDPPELKRDDFVDGIPPCVKDLFSALYWARGREIAGGIRHRSLVGDNDKVKEVEVRVEKWETVQTPGGTFETWRLNTVAVLGGLFKSGGQFRIWLTADQRKVPVKFEAKVNFGKITGRLVEMPNAQRDEGGRSRP